MGYKILFSAFFLLIFMPMFTNICFYYCEKKVFFYFTIFKIKILSGYIEVNGKYIVVHLSNKKAILFNYTDILNKGKGYKSIKLFEIYDIFSVLELNYLSNIAYIQGGQIYLLLNNVLRIVGKIKKPFMVIRNDLIVNKNDTNIKFLFDVKILFNIFVILTLIISKLMEKIDGNKKQRVNW